LDEVVEVIQALLEKLPIDSRRIYLTGLSMGGFGAWELAGRCPELFAAVAPICGGGRPSEASRLTHVSVWAVHGRNDDVVPVACSRDMVAAIRQAGGSPKYSEVEGVGHNCWSFAYGDESGLLDWMFSQVNDNPSPGLTSPVLQKASRSAGIR
jgi:predicted peptidase